MTVSVKKKFDNIDDGIANMIAAAIYDYNNWSRNEASEEMKKEFADGFVVKKGKKFYEVPINYNGRSHEEGKKIKFYHILPVIIQIFKGKFF